MVGIGIVGGGYMGKAHAVAMQAVASIFRTPLRPHLACVCARSRATAERYAAEYGFARAVTDWRHLVEDPNVGAVVIASPQTTHRAVAEAAFALGKPVFCEKPLGATVEDAEAMVAAANSSGVANMVGFNYIRTPASQYCRKLIADGRIGEVHWFRGEHTEDFYDDPEEPATWRSEDRTTGTMGDLAPHMVNAARSLVGPIAEVMAEIRTVYPMRGGVPAKNDDQGQMLCRFAGGATGHLFFSRVASGKKMGYAYEIHGSMGTIRFDQEDQNSLWLFTKEGPEAERGFKRILTGPHHPDFGILCPGPGHGTGYQEQIIIEARDFLNAVAGRDHEGATFEEGLAVHRVIEAAWTSVETGTWQKVTGT